MSQEKCSMAVGSSRRLGITTGGTGVSLYPGVRQLCESTMGMQPRKTVRIFHPSQVSHCLSSGIPLPIPRKRHHPTIWKSRPRLCNFFLDFVPRGTPEIGTVHNPPRAAPVLSIFTAAALVAVNRVKVLSTEPEDAGNGESPSRETPKLIPNSAAIGTHRALHSLANARMVGGDERPVIRRRLASHTSFPRRSGNAPGSGMPPLLSSNIFPAAGDSEEIAGPHRFGSREGWAADRARWSKSCQCG